MLLLYISSSCGFRQIIIIIINYNLYTRFGRNELILKHIPSYQHNIILYINIHTHTRQFIPGYIKVTHA